MSKQPFTVDETIETIFSKVSEEVIGSGYPYFQTSPSRSGFLYRQHLHSGVGEGWVGEIQRERERERERETQRERERERERERKGRREREMKRMKRKTKESERKVVLSSHLWETIE